MRKFLGFVALCVGLLAAPTRAPFDCRTIGNPELCIRTPGCAFHELKGDYAAHLLYEGCFPQNETQLRVRMIDMTTRR
jgi:hypothetical protein